MLCVISLPTFAMDNADVPIDVITVNETAESEVYTIPQAKLKGTNLEGKVVTIEDDVLYVDGARSATVTVYIAGVLAGWLIDGVLIYSTGYSGAQLLAAGINSLVRAWNSYQNMTVAYFNSYNSYLSSFTLSNGNQCVATSATTYACMYSL